MILFGISFVCFFVCAGSFAQTNDNGKVVPPGIYVYRILVKADSGNHEKSGTIVVAY